VPQLIRRATEVDSIRVGGQSAAHKAEHRPSDSLTDRATPGGSAKQYRDHTGPPS
jgi:hypothetical protein